MRARWFTPPFNVSKCQKPCIDAVETRFLKCQNGKASDTLKSYKTLASIDVLTL